MYLIEKYGERWCQRVLKRPEPLHLSEAAWLKNVLFNPCSRLARQVACNMLESLCQVSVRKRTVSTNPDQFYMSSFITNFNKKVLLFLSFVIA